MKFCSSVNSNQTNHMKNDLKLSENNSNCSTAI